MYDRKYLGKVTFKAAYVDGVREFVAYAMSREVIKLEGGIRCLYLNVCLGCFRAEGMF